MSDQTKQAIEQFVQKVLLAAEQAGSFTAEQMPLLVQEWLRWKVVEAVMWGAGSFVALMAFLGLLRWAWRKIDSDDEAHALCTVLCALPILAASISTLYWLSSLIQIIVAPRVVILNTFMELVR